MICSLKSPSCRNIRGKVLLNAVKEQDHAAVAELLQHTLSIVQQSGLIDNDVEVARRILGSRSDNKKSNRSKASTLVSNVEAQYVLTAVLAVLSSHENGSSNATVSQASHLVTAICEHLKQAEAPDDCFLAEFELLSNSGKPLLVQLLRILETCDSDPCLQAGCALISVLNTRLSRSLEILDGFRTKCWVTLRTRDSSSAVQLLATLALAGYKDQSPAALWSGLMFDYVTAVQSVMNAVAPIDHSALHSSNDKQGEGSLLWHEVQQWIGHIRDADDSDTGSLLFVRLLNILVDVIVALLRRESVGLGAATASQLQHQFLQSVVPTASLDVTEMLLRFSFRVESVFYSTKKRLRANPVDNGILSSKALVRVGNDVRSIGHRLLDNLVVCCGASLLPFARRLRKMALVALQSSSSRALKTALDPTVVLDASKPSFLHSSVALRSAAVRSIGCTLRAFGTEPERIRKGQKRSSMNNASDTGRSNTFICGILIEQLSNESTDDWGTLEERIELIVGCAECLAAYLDSGGIYLSPSTRELVDSTTVFGLDSVCKGVSSIVSSSRIKVAFLVLGRTCVCVPWRDGVAASNEIACLLRDAAKTCQKDGDPNVVGVASSTLAVCDALQCPRSPALRVITKSDSSKYALAHSTTDGLIMTIKDAQKRINIAQETVNGKESTDVTVEEPPRKVPKNAQVVPETTEVDKNKALVTDNALLRDNTPAKELTTGTVVQISSESMSHADSETYSGNKKHGAETVGPPCEEESGDEDIDFPEIVECGPDDDDQ